MVTSPDKISVRPISEVRANISQLVDRAFYAQECFVITHHEEARAVLIPIHSMRTLELLEQVMIQDSIFASEESTEEISLEEIRNAFLLIRVSVNILLKGI